MNGLTREILKNLPNHPSEILCEVDSTDKHPKYSLAVSVIDKSFTQGLNF